MQAHESPAGPPTMSAAQMQQHLVGWYAAQEFSEADSPDLTPDKAMAALRSVVQAGETPAVIDMYERACWNCGITPDETAAQILALRS